ncbi:phospho-sugar mutase [Angustibacter sp. Root456]|uniref:phospho-sugar mutase n=1 Tax=Angustibacter sp. Root456 TaxID=1736539 RepID=UPI0006FC5FF6|nr:phospho-sugar mutase [Angustibacter sp. Root456]KQX69973.1 phosphomannomutase [Angustibacter sp. Root456]
MAVDDELFARAVVWRDDDPDTTTRAELEDVVAAARGGDLDALADLADRFAGTLEFGTAGLRGRIGAGPNRMNRAVVIRAAAGLVAYLQAQGRAPRVVIGYDARHRSDDFARDTATVVVAAGGEALLLPRPLPTPVLAYAIRHVGADAGVMVTASHNPPQDNGYKVYLGDGSQIVPPADAEIAAEIAKVVAVAEVPRADDGWQVLDEDVLDAYLDAAARVVADDAPRDLDVVHTPLHGVGRDVLVAALQRAGFAAPFVVPSQGDPDPDFPTVAFPNPEEPGAIDAALDAARERGADIVLANDPDADRCAVAVPDPASAGGWRMLRGDEVGVLLGAFLIERGVPDDAVMACSIVSSRQLAAVCAAHGVEHRETLTGFKWISRVPGLRYGYEEALGYCVDPDAVRDKDGVSAALLMAELAARLKADGRTLLDRLDDIARETGVYATDQHSVRVADLSLISDAMARLRSAAPTELGGSAVERADDLSAGSDDLPPTDGLRYYLADGSRVVVRPSGTEPKLKAYLEVVEPVADDVATARATAHERLAALKQSVAEAIGL